MRALLQDAVQLSEKLKDFEDAYYPWEDHLFQRAFRRAAAFCDRWLQ